MTSWEPSVLMFRPWLNTEICIWNILRCKRILYHFFMALLDVLLFVHILANSSYLSQKAIKISFDFFFLREFFKIWRFDKNAGFSKDLACWRRNYLLGWIERELNCSKNVVLLSKCLQFFLRLVNPHLCKPQSFVVKLFSNRVFQLCNMLFLSQLFWVRIWSELPCYQKHPHK